MKLKLSDEQRFELVTFGICVFLLLAMIFMVRSDCNRSYNNPDQNTKDSALSIEWHDDEFKFEFD